VASFSICQYFFVLLLDECAAVRVCVLSDFHFALASSLTNASEGALLPYFRGLGRAGLLRWQC
jgi:hypothetical protein